MVDVTGCGFAPLFVQVTTAPVLTVALLGVNALSVMLTLRVVTADAGSTVIVPFIPPWIVHSYG